MKYFGFSKQEHICKRDDFHELLSNGQSVYCYPFRCVYLWRDLSPFSVRIAVSVSRRRFKRAVDRNKVKRLIRESYRLEKHQLYKHYVDCNQSLDILIVYTDTKILSFLLFRKSFIKLINKLIKKNDSLSFSDSAENLQKRCD